MPLQHLTQLRASFLQVPEPRLGAGLPPRAPAPFPGVRVCAFGLHRGSQHHAVHGHIHLPQGLCRRGAAGATAAAARKKRRAWGAARGAGMGRASHTPPLGPLTPHLLFPRATLDSPGSSACQGPMESV